MITLFLAGDVMTGRGIDQVLPHPGDPRIYEAYAKSAVDYVKLAEQANGSIEQPVAFDYIWGDALAELDRRKPDARIVNLETAVTLSAAPEPKGINYKMSPANVPAITAAKIDCCTLANNHVLDWGRRGLVETLCSLEEAGVRYAGAGRNQAAASAPAVLALPDKARVLVYGFASPTSGVPCDWAATDREGGVNLLETLSARHAQAVADRIHAVRRPRDVVIVSIHWGANWGYTIPEEQVAFAHRLIETGDVDIVHGHSSHHVKAIEVYREKLILYGCGDFIDDYEGISGHEAFRDDLVLMYFPTLRVADGSLASLEMVPLQIRNMRLHYASPADVAWLAGVLCREGFRLGTRVSAVSDRTLRLAWV